MPIDFPNSPANGDTYSEGTKTWQYNGTAWDLVLGSVSIPSGSVDTAQLASGAVTTAKILAGAVTTAKIAADAVTLGTKTTGDYVTNLVAGTGGSGVVIVRWSSALAAATSTTGSPTYNSGSGGYHIYTFNGTGSITP